MSEHDERHTMLPATEHEEPVPACLDCETWCDASMPCRCCLTLRAEKAEAAIARVRAAAMVNFPDGEVAHPPDGMYHDPSVFYGLRAAAYEVLAALDEPEVTA